MSDEFRVETGGGRPSGTTVTERLGGQTYDLRRDERQYPQPPPILPTKDTGRTSEEPLSQPTHPPTPGRGYQSA